MSHYNSKLRFRLIYAKHQKLYFQQRNIDFSRVRRWWQSGNDKEVKLILSCTSIVVLQRATQTMGQTAGNFYTHRRKNLEKPFGYRTTRYACQNSNQNTFVHLSPYSELRRNCFVPVVVTVAQQNICAIVHCNTGICVLILDTAVNRYV